MTVLMGHGRKWNAERKLKRGNSYYQTPRSYMEGFQSVDPAKKWWLCGGGSKGRGGVTGAAVTFARGRAESRRGSSACRVNAYHGGNDEDGGLEVQNCSKKRRRRKNK